jgi:nucleoside-diphosphate-sugar epimerase
MKLLVTGASGFVGGYVVRELLRRGHVVTGLVRREGSVQALAAEGMLVAVGDISRADSLRDPMRGQEAVIHLAAVVGKNPGGWENHLSQGVGGTENVVVTAVGAKVPRVLHLSSCVVYKTPADSSPITEESPVEDQIEPWNHYLRQKVRCEEIVRRFESQLAVTMIRPPTVIGAGDPGLIPLLSAISRSPLGALAKDAGHHFPVVVVEDLAEGIADALDRPAAAGQTYNLAAARPVTKAALLSEFAKAGHDLGSDSTRRKLAISAAAGALDIVETGLRVFGARAARAPRRFLTKRLEDHAHRRVQPDLIIDTSRARRELGFKGTRDLAQAIRRTVSWYRDSATAT